MENKAHQKLEITPLKKLFFNPKKTEKLFRTNFCVLKTDQKNIDDYVQHWDGKKWTQLKGKKAPTGGELRWNIKLIVTDYTNQDDDKAYMVHLDDNNFFKNIKPANWSDVKEIKKSEKAFQTLKINKSNYV